MLDITPGPLMFQKHGAMIWALIASMYVGNALLLLLNWPLVNLFARVMSVPAKYLMPIVLVISTIGVWSLSYSEVDLVLTGAAGVLELARVFARAKPKATLIFIAFSGEEQGLVGSAAWVRAQTTETRARIKQVLTMDMIGYSKDESLDVLLETSERFKPLHDQLLAASRLVDGLHAYSSFNPFGSDHMSFINQDISAILTIDYDWESYPAYHRTGDTIDKVSREMGTAILKMNAGALGAWILPAPAPGIQTTPPQTSP
jgi:hypothetical protein